MAQEDDSPVDLKTAGALPILYSFRRCPYAMRARMAIAVSGQRCELREVVLRDKPAELLAASPKGTVPVLVDVDGRVIDQSLDIMLWALRRNDPEHWLPADRERSTRCCRSSPNAMAISSGTSMATSTRSGSPTATPPTHRAHGAVFLTRLDARLQASRCLHGEQPALADIAIAPFVRQFAQVDAAWFEAQPWPRLREWLAASVERARLRASDG